MSVLGSSGRVERLAAVTTLSLVGFGVVQILLGEFVSRSVVLTANGIDCVGDGFVSCVVWVGLLLMKRPADERFHFGYFKVENLASLGAAVVMFVLASYIIVRSYYQLVSPVVVQVPLLGAVVAGLSAVVALGLGVYKMRLGKTVKLSSGRLEAVNTVKDGTTSALTVLTLVLVSFGLNFDPYVGFVMAGIIYSVGVAAIKESGFVLLDACDGECINLGTVVRSVALGIPGVKGAHVVRLRPTGPVFFGEIELMVSREMTVAQFEVIRLEFSRKVKERAPEIEGLSVVSRPES